MIFRFSFARNENYKQNRRLVGPRNRKTTKNPYTAFVAFQSIGIAPTTPPTPQTDAHHKPRTRPKNRKTTKNSYKAFVAFRSIGIATTPKIPPWNRTNEFVGAPTAAAAANVQQPTLIPVKEKLETDERYNVPPPPHPYYTLICEHSRAKLQKKHHDHLVHDAYSKKKQKRERRILISLDGNTDSHIPTKYSPAVIPTSPSNQYSRNHKENLLYDAYCKKKKNRHEINSNPPVLKKPSS